MYDKHDLSICGSRFAFFLDVGGVDKDERQQPLTKTKKYYQQSGGQVPTDHGIQRY